MEFGLPHIQSLITKKAYVDIVCKILGIIETKGLDFINNPDLKAYIEDVYRYGKLNCKYLDVHHSLVNLLRLNELGIQTTGSYFGELIDADHYEYYAEDWERDQGDYTFNLKEIEDLRVTLIILETYLRDASFDVQLIYKAKIDTFKHNVETLYTWARTIWKIDEETIASIIENARTKALYIMYV